MVGFVNVFVKKLFFLFTMEYDTSNELLSAGKTFMYVVFVSQLFYMVDL